MRKKRKPMRGLLMVFMVIMVIMVIMASSIAQKQEDGNGDGAMAAILQIIG